MSEIKWLHISDLHFDGAKAKYMFSWNEISGKDSGRFIDFLRQKHHMDWVKADYINKNGNGKIIKLTDGKNVISLHLINENTEVNLNFNNDIIDEFIVDTEKDQLNIYEKNLYDENKVLNPLLNTIEEKKPDLIFVTGDIGMSGEKKDYILAKKFFKDMLSRAKIKSDRLWIVPGNHDVERDIFLQRTIDSDKSVKFFGEPKARKHQITKFNSYVKFIQDMFPTRQLAECDAVHKPTVLKIGDFPIGILSLNSAWFSQGNDDKDNLWIGERMVRERSEQLEKQLKEEKCSLKLIIGILHHPFEYLHTSDTSEIWIRNNCKIVLRGHLHKMDAKIVIDTNGRALEIIGGPTYQGSGKPCRAFFTTFNTQSSIISLEPLMYLDKPTVKAWTVDTTVFTQYPYTMKYKLPLTYDNESDASDGVGSNGDNNNPIFPFSDWKYVNTHNWMLCITEWFKHAYDKDPEKSMKELIDHIFDIIIHIENNPSVDKNIKDLGKALFHSNLITIQEHHKNILKLLELGIQQDLPHLFMLPQVENNNLLKVPRYSQLILASRYLSAGYCEKSKELTKSIAKGCCIASYIYAQSARKMEIFGEAKYFLESNIDILEKNYKKSCFHKQECSFADGFKLNCNYDLKKRKKLK